MGCKYNGYSSDMTRTIFVDSISERLKRIRICARCTKTSS